MRKQALINLHALAAEIRDFLVEQESVPPDAFVEYDRNGITPAAFHHNKTIHKKSLLLLLDEILVSVGRLPVRNAPR